MRIVAAVVAANMVQSLMEHNTDSQEADCQDCQEA